MPSQVMNTEGAILEASQNYGWDTATSVWKKLLVEDATNPNLRVKLYDGANEIGSQLVTADLTTQRALSVHAIVSGYSSAARQRLIEARQGNSDVLPAIGWGLTGICFLHGFDGTYWERLRTYDTGILKVGDAIFGNIYSKTMTMADNNATRFEATAKKLRDCVIIVKTHPMLLGETGVEVYPVGAEESIGFTKVDISTLYFKNAGADNNGVITILGVEE